VGGEKADQLKNIIGVTIVTRFPNDIHQTLQHHGAMEFVKGVAPFGSRRTIDTQNSDH
jgi:hypothetical protein